MNYLNYCHPTDIARRIFRRKRHWFHGKPKIKISGNTNAFGKLEFDFGDQKLIYNIWIKDRELILDAAHMAVENFSSLSQQFIIDGNY